MHIHSHIQFHSLCHIHTHMHVLIHTLIQYTHTHAHRHTHIISRLCASALRPSCSICRSQAIPWPSPAAGLRDRLLSAGSWPLRMPAYPPNYSELGPG
jgi:hypothetical protein